MLGQIQVRKEIAERLKKARENAGYNSPQAFCEANNLSLEEYTAFEDSSVPLITSKALLYCKLLGISLHWLMLGENLSRFYEKPVF